MKEPSATPNLPLRIPLDYSTQDMQPFVYLRQLQLAFSAARCWSSLAAKFALGLLLELIKKSLWQGLQP